MTSRFVASPIKEIRAVAQSAERKVAAIAYVTKDHADLAKSDILVCDASNRAIQTRATCRSLLRKWVDAGVQVYSLQDLHTKMIVFDHQRAFIGSANFSEFAERRVECGIFTSDSIVVAECEKFILDLTQRSKLIDAKFLKRVDGLKLRPTPASKPTPKSAKESTLKYWFFKGTTRLSKKSLELERLMRSGWNTTASEETTEDFDDDEEIPGDENPLCFDALRHTSPRWVQDISRGDRVFWCYDHEDYGWIVLPPRTVVSTQSRGRAVLAGTEGRYRDEEDSVRLSVFLEELGLRKNVSLESIAPSNAKLIQLLSDWNRLVD